jgi:hypothetical protein
VKICGIYFGKNAQKLNEEKLLEKLKKKAYAILPRINTKWSRVKTINLLILAKFWHLVTVQEVSDLLLGDIERTIFKLIWTKIERVKRSTLTLPIEEDELGVIHLKAKIRAFRIKHIIDIFKRPRVQWDSFAIYWLNIPLRKELAQTDHQIGKRGLKPSPFYQIAVEQFKEFQKASLKPLKNDKII